MSRPTIDDFLSPDERAEAAYQEGYEAGLQQAARSKAQAERVIASLTRRLSEGAALQPPAPILVPVRSADEANFLEAAKAFAAAHVECDALECEEDHQMAAGLVPTAEFDKRHDAADEAYNRTKAAMVEAYLRLQAESNRNCRKSQSPCEQQGEVLERHPESGRA